LGFVVGYLLSVQLGPNIFKVTMVSITPNFKLLGWAICIGPLFAAISSLIPVLWAVNQDAAKLLNEH